MLVYGDRVRIVDPRVTAEDLAEDLRRAAQFQGMERHGALAACLILAGQLVQGLADAAFEAAGWDDQVAEADHAMAAAVALARLVAASWNGAGDLDFGEAHMALQTLIQTPLPPQVRIKTPEGYAFYALYPEAYWQAARDLQLQGAAVIGLRSIGASLAAMAAAAAGGDLPVTLRPAGHPFDRRYRLSPRLEQRLSAASGPVVVVDEGPGMSGSSFCAAGETLEALGVAAARQVFMPSHLGGPGPAASPQHQARWARTRRGCVTFDQLAVGRHGLQHWFEDELGAPLAPLQDLSGGGWRSRRYGLADAPVFAWQERRKFLLRTGGGDWLLKFVGLGRLGQDRFERARRLADAGFTPPATAWRHGFMAQPWIDAGPVQAAQRAGLVERLGAYLGFRAATLPAPPDSGASLAELVEMARHNMGEALGAAAAEAAASLPLLAAGAAAPSRVRTDNRLHAWEWLAPAQGPLLKTDAVDHDDAHDLVGCQDIAWDIAGARVEFSLSEDETTQLCDAVASACGRRVDPGLLALMDVCYPAFQLGYWTTALSSAAENDRSAIVSTVDRYAGRLRSAA